MLRSNAPEDQRSRNTDDAYRQWPQTMLRFHDTIVATREFDGQPIAHSSCGAEGDDGAQAAGEIAQADH